jgi:hypothetical protein
MYFFRVFFYVVLLLIPLGCKDKAPVTSPKDITYSHAANFDHMRISFMEGEVEMRTLEAADWGYTALNNPVREGDEFWVPRGGRLEIQLNSGTCIRLDQESDILMLSKEKNSVQFYITQGHAYVVHDALDGIVAQVDTKDASTRAFVNSFFRIDKMDKYTEVGAFKKFVEVENNAGNVRVNAGEMVSLAKDTNGEVAPMGGEDEWEKWNIARNHGGGLDTLVEASTKTKTPDNLPDELKTYSSELSNSGKWLDVPQYGKVWTPAVEAGWAPYKNGRWVWRDDDYVWVASEPWGWAPYHYGRWAFVEGMGWCWVPPVAGDAYWSPGYVAWVRTEDYVAWVPLAPGEIYYGRGDYGKHSVNIIKANINQDNVTNVYKNVQVNYGVTVVSRNTFAKALPRIERLDQRIIQDKIFTRNNISVGAPAIKPTRESYFASSKMIPASKLPPQAVRNIQVRELKQERPLVGDQGKSVMSPGMKAKSLPINHITTPRTPGKLNRSISLVRPGQDQEPTQKPGMRAREKLGKNQEQEPTQKPRVAAKQNPGKEQKQEATQKPRVAAKQNLGKEQKQEATQKPRVAAKQNLGKEQKQEATQKPHMAAKQNLSQNQKQATQKPRDMDQQKPIKNQKLRKPKKDEQKEIK